jgi:hypothetical protein
MVANPREARCVRWNFPAFVTFAIAAAACDGGQHRVQLPMFFSLDATASANEGEMSVECEIAFLVEIAGEVSRTDEVIEYVGTMGGSAGRTILREDGSGVGYIGDYYFPNLQVLHILPSRIQLVSDTYRPDEPVSSRFGAELHFWEGALQPDGSILGSWTCAPMDVDDHGVEDYTIFAEGLWTTTTLSR